MSKRVRVVWLPVLVVVFALAGAGSAAATAIHDHSGFSAGQTVITFDDVTGEGTTPVGAQYGAQGVTFSGLFYGYASSYGGSAWPGSRGGTAADFAGNSCPCFNDVTVTFAGSVKRAGFDILMNFGDSVELEAFRGGVQVDDQTFVWSGIAFEGVDVPGGFDRLVIHPNGSANGAFVMDDFRFDGLAAGAPPWVPPPPHAAVCSVAGNTNPFSGAAIAPGTFLDLLAEQITSDPHYAGATPALFVAGKGLTCDAPPAGYTQQGFAGDAQHVASGYYPYWAPPA